MKKKITIVVVTYQTNKNILLKCLKSIDKDNLLNKTFECGSYGCKSYDFDNVLIYSISSINL